MRRIPITKCRSGHVYDCWKWRGCPYCKPPQWRAAQAARGAVQKRSAEATEAWVAALGERIVYPKAQRRLYAKLRLNGISRADAVTECNRE